MASGLLAGPASAGQPQPQPRPLPAPRLPNTFLLTPTDQLGFPGQKPGTLVTPDGDLFTGWAELTFNLGGSSTFEPRSQTRQEGRYPIVRMFKVVNGILYELTAFQAPVNGKAVVFARIDARNLTGRFARARVGAGIRYDGGEFGTRSQTCCIRIYRFPRPRTPTREGLFDQPGVGFNAASQYALSGNALLRDGLAVALFPGAGPGIGVSQSLSPDSPPFNTRSQFGRTIYNIALQARERKSLVFKMPIDPMPQADPNYAAVNGARFAQYRGIVRSFWRRLLGGAMGIQIPERKVRDAFYANIVNDALSRYQLPNGTWMQAVNKLRYHAFWLRDGSIITNMYDLVGLHRLAAENLDFFLTWQQDDGLFISRPQEYDGHGQALWAFGEHYRRTGDVAFAQRVMPAVRRAMDWFERQRASDPLTLMPPNTSLQDNELIRGHLAGDNFWAAAGVSGAIDLARAVGDNATADRWAGVYASFKAALLHHIGNAARANNGAIPPSLDVRGGQDWGNLWGYYPARVIGPNSQLMRRTLFRVRRRFREGIATYANTRLLHHYLGFRVFQTELAAGDQARVVQGLYDELAHTTGSHAGFEAGTAPFGDRVVDDVTVPHGWFAAEYVVLLRNMLVREDGANLYLMSALSPSWLRPGKRVGVSRAPTLRGPVTFSLRGTAGGAVLTWDARVSPGTRLLWPVPYAAQNVSARGLNARQRVITLPGRSGSLVVRWRLTGAAPTYEAAYTRLLRRYFNSTAGAVETARNRREALPTVPSRTG